MAFAGSQFGRNRGKPAAAHCLMTRSIEQTAP